LTPMSDGMLKVYGIAILAAMLCLLLKKWNAETATLVKVVGGVVICGICLGAVSPIITYMYELSQMSGMSEQISVLVRVLCVAVITHVASNVCKDCGEATLAGYAELGGKIEILLLSLPLIEGLVGTVIELAG